MRPRIGILSGLLLLGRMEASCSHKQNNAIQDNDLSFSKLKIDTTAYLLSDTANPSCYFELSMNYPTSASSADMLAIVQKLYLECYLGKQYADLTPQAAAEKYMKSYVADYQQDEKDYEPSLRQMYMDWTEQSSCDVTYNQAGFLSLAASYFCYAGGAHGSNGTLNHVIDLNSKTILALTDLFAEGDYPDVGKLIIQQITRDYNYTDPAKLADDGFFNIEDVLPNDNFRIDADGITWTYNPYEIAAYSAGQINVTLSWELVKPYLFPDSPVMPLAEFATK